MQQDGKIVLVGESEYCINGICGASQFIMMRLNTDGTLDTSFGNNGHLLTNDVFTGSTGTYSIPKSLYILPNGKFMIGGTGPGGKPFIGRLNSNGFPDATYGTNGIFSVTNLPSISFKDLVVGPNGETYGLLSQTSWNVSAGVYDTADYSNSVVFKLTPNGSYDPTFGTNGIQTIDTDVTDTPFSLTLSSAGKIMVIGSSMPEHFWFSTMTQSGSGQVNKGFFALLNSNGTLDTSIPNGFKTFVFPQDLAATFTKIIERNANEFLITGYSTTLVNGNFQHKGLVVSVNNQGTLNTSFNGTGYMGFDHGQVGTSGWNGKLANFLDIDLTPDNGILLTGYRNPTAGATKGSIYILKLTFGPTSNLAVEEISREAVFSAYPNPVTNHHFMINSDEAAAIQLVSLDGRILYESEVSEGVSQITMDPDYKGVAILKLQTQDGKAGTRKVLFE
ncbi:MAG: T9SS type A sorting domain-containing protein [Fluviicola sp.]